MKVFITGVTGFLGRSISAYLLAEGYQIAGSSRRKVTMPGVEVFHAALGDRIEAAMFQNCDAVIHAAHDFEPESMEKNIDGTLALRDAAAKAEIRQQIFLTSYSALPDAESEYGRTKYHLEQFFVNSGSVNLRLGLVIGYGGLFSRQRAMLLRAPVVPVIDAGDYPVAVVAISHAVAATETIIRTRAAGPWNLFYDVRPTMKELIREIKKDAGQRPLLFPIGAQFAVAAVKAARSVGLRIPVDPGQIRALQRNAGSDWPSDLPALLGERSAEFHLRYALDQVKTKA